MEIFKNTNFDFLGKKWPFIIASLVLTVAGVASLAMKGGPRYGIDFKGGTVTTVRFANAVTEDQIRAALTGKIPGEIVVQRDTTARDMLISTELRDEKELNAARSVVMDSLAAAFNGKDGSKLDLSNAGQGAVADRLRSQMGAAMNEDQLQEVSKAILAFRDTQKSGMLGTIDALSGVQGVNAQVIDALKKEAFVAPYQIGGFDLVGPKVGNELRTQAINATLMALAGMLIYIAFRFEFIYGLAAVIAVFHDTVITIGLFSLVDKEISLTVIAALLTLVGFSMNDTIVVFDRIRENLPSMRKEKFETIVNTSINQTLSRTILTSGLTFLTAVALWLFGGPVLNGFSFALVAGIIVGTYSSIFIASPILIWWRNWMEQRRAGTPPTPGASPVSAGGKVKAAK
ncbi:MAG: protein translocase subunit SecF [Acidobacteria bacterium]|nr:protein translocase subunit SecF [Acidobacteriota bacterium]